MQYKTCKKCGETKPISGFGLRSGSSVGRLRGRCRSCETKDSAAWRKAHLEQNRVNQANWRHSHGGRPLQYAKDAAGYLGVYVSERILSRYFDNIKQMPPNNPGYDFICGRGYKIDAKSSCLVSGGPKAHCARWSFRVDYNQTADYFLCLAFNDRESLDPMHIWLFPANAINHLSSLTIQNNEKSISKHTKYEKPIDKVVFCCEQLKHSPVV